MVWIFSEWHQLICIIKGIKSPDYIRNVFIVFLDPENMGIDTAFVIFTFLVSELLEITVF